MYSPLEQRVIDSLQARIDDLTAENAKLEKPRTERKYFLEEHQALLAKMVPPDDDSTTAAVSSDGLGDELPVLADLTDCGAAVTGKIFAQMMVSGFINLLANMDRLNKENQFPIPDGDTGTNMVICFKKAVCSLVISTAASTEPSLVDVTSNFCDDVVMNGQGNSGTILSHYFKTLSVEVAKIGKAALSPGEFATVLDATGTLEAWSHNNQWLTFC
jgi:hypothetical protein